MASAPQAAAASWCSETVNPGILREAASITETRYSLPSPVSTSVPSPYHLWFGLPAGNWRLTRSGARQRPRAGTSL